MAENIAPDRNENIRVVVRGRPLSTEEINAGYDSIASFDGVQHTISLKDPNESAAVKSFTFDHVFGPECTQPDIFNQVARPIIDNVLEGYNGTIFAYGQTGSGKTFTMEGVSERAELRGIIPNSFAHIFGQIAKAEAHRKFLVRVSYFEIYMEQIRDLLAKKSDRERTVSSLEVKEDKEKGVYVKGLTEQVVHSADDLDKIMAIGKKNRVTAATKMNLHSSRSHAIFSVTVERSERPSDGRMHICVGKLNLVDLAGSERQSKSEAVDDRLKEAAKINHGLSNLGNVIAALTDGKSTHVPYRNSKLTRILQDSLGGNSKTVMCANLGPASYNYDETMNTLRYATRAKWIKNAAKINEDPKDAILKRLETEIQTLRRQLADSSGLGKDSDYEEDEEDQKRRTEMQQERKKRRDARTEQLKQMQNEIAAQREELERNTLLGHQQREKLRRDIAAKEDQLDLAEKERQGLLEKLSLLEKTIIVGGENLLDKAEEQERLLEENARELELRRKKEEDLRKNLLNKKTERSKIEEKFATLQEIAAGKKFETARLKAEISSLMTDLKDLRQDNSLRMEEGKNNKKDIEKNIHLYKKIIDRYLPIDMQALIEANCSYNQDIGEWEVSCLAFTGAMMHPDQSKMTPGGPQKPFSYGDALAWAEQRKLERPALPNWETLFRCYAEELV